MKNILITGTAGFIGFHLAKLLLNDGFKVHGYDAITSYYDIKIKIDKVKEPLLPSCDVWVNLPICRIVEVINKIN